MVTGHDEWDDTSRGTLRKDLAAHSERTVNGHEKIHRQPYRPMRTIPLGQPGQESGLPDDHYTVLRQSHAQRAAEMRRREELEKISTAHLHLHPVPNITPDYGPTADGRREYTLKLRQDLVHGGFHTMRATLGVDGGGEVWREAAAIKPLTSGELGYEYHNTISRFHFAFDEMIQLACCALDAHGVSWYDACRLIEQNMQQLQAQQQMPPERPEGA